MSDFHTEALARVRADGLLIDALIPDGKLHRCKVEGKERNRDGAYIIHADNPATAWWRNWKTGADGTHSEKNPDAMTAKERREFQARIKAAREKAKAEQEKRWAAGAKVAQVLWDAGKPATDHHPYLRRKQVQSYGLRIGRYNNLLVPVLGEDGKIQAIQKITTDGGKFFHADGKTSGGWFHIPSKDGGKDGPLLLAEGYATAASLHMATGYAVLISFNAGNLLAVAKLARSKYPARTICICGDYDKPTPPIFPNPGGIGVEKAKAAADAAGACLAICPTWEGRDKADFNDLAEALGLDRVKNEIEKAFAKGPVTNCPLPDGYRLVLKGKGAGLYFIQTKSDGTFDEIRLGPPLEVVAATRDNDSADWGLMLAWHDPDGKEHTWAMPRSLLYAQRGEWFSMLAYGGWLGNPSCRKWIAAFLSAVQPLRRIRCVATTGWHDDRYVLPDKVYGNGEDDLVLQSLLHDGLFRSGGNMDGWQEMAALCVGNSRLGFALCCAFAGPVLRLAGIEGGGFSFEGPSSSGKTTALQAAASVWGGPEHLRAWRATDNGLESVAMLHNDNLMVLDELGQVNARVMNDAVYMLANGAGKARAGKDGGLRKSYRWLALVLSSGEVGLADKLAEDGRKARAGQDVRFCGIAVDKAHIVELHGMEDAGLLIRRIKELCNQNYGHAGRLFLEKLTEPATLADARENLRNQVEQLAVKFCPAGADGQVMRVALRFAVAGCAGALAVGLGILPEQFRALEYAGACFDSWLEKRGGSGAAEDMAILEQVQTIIERDGQSRFQNLDAGDAFCVNRLGFVKHEEGKADEFIILPNQFKAEFAKGFSERRVAEVLRQAGWLEIGVEGRNKTRRSLPGMGRQRVYVLRLPDEK